MTKHLAYFYEGAYNYGETRHAQDVMKDIGITYQYSTPQSLGSAFWFWNCENIPEVLPEYIQDLNIDDPMKFIGFGLSKEKAEFIVGYKVEKI